MRTIGTPIAFGSNAPLPLKGFPPGKYRIRLRENEFAKVYVKTDDGIREFTAKITDEHWTPGLEMGRNIRGQCARCEINGWSYERNGPCPKYPKCDESFRHNVQAIAAADESEPCKHTNL